MEYPTSEAHFVPTKLQLPLFLTSRNRIRINRFWEVRYYIAKNARRYAPCIGGRDDADEEIDTKDDNKTVEIHMRPLKFSRNSNSEKSHKLPPNRYNVTKEIGHSRKGMKGAYWSQLKRSPIGGKPIVVRNATAFYEIPRDSEKFQRGCLCHKGKLLSDPRKRRPSSRFMVSNIFTCWRNPKDPGPAEYFIGIFDRQMFPKVKTKPPISYKFLRFSCVPERDTPALSKKSSFDPGPGRYELLDDEDAFCFALQVEKQKRLKFRRLQFQRVVYKDSRRPLWRHISGYGFTRLFRGPPLRPAVAVSNRKARKVNHDIKLFPSFEYIKMITTPQRHQISIRMTKTESKMEPMRYNCIVRVIIRRQLRNNKKIAFNSGMPRFPDSDMPTTKKTAKPPPLADHPVMRMPLSEIRSKLHALPKRLMGTFKENRIRPFKFQPFPPIKLLLDENEVRPEYARNAEIYPSELNPWVFFKDEFKKHHK